MTTARNSAPPLEVPRALGRLRVALNDSFTDASRELGLTAQQAELVCWAMRPRPIGELAGLMHCDRSNISRMVDRAAARGLVQRHGTHPDGRVSMIELTAEGQRLADEFLAKLESLTAPLLASWSATRQHQAAQNLRALAQALETSADPSSQEPVVTGP